jgi:hypothetical protein
MNALKDPEAAETAQTTSVTAVDLPRLVRFLDDRAAVIVSWPIFWMIDYCGAKCGEWDFDSHRAESKTFLQGIWSRYSSKPNNQPSGH